MKITHQLKSFALSGHILKWVVLTTYEMELQNTYDVMSMPDLTECERKVAFAFMKGLVNKEIAQEIGMSYRMVKFHISRLLKKFNCVDRHQLYILLTAFKGEQK